MAVKDLLTEEVLKKLYIDQDMTQQEIADKFKVSVTTVCRYLKKFDMTKETAEKIEDKVFGAEDDEIATILSFLRLIWNKIIALVIRKKTKKKDTKEEE